MIPCNSARPSTRPSPNSKPLWAQMGRGMKGHEGPHMMSNQIEAEARATLIMSYTLGYKMSKMALRMNAFSGPHDTSLLAAAIQQAVDESTG